MNSRFASRPWAPILVWAFWAALTGWAFWWLTSAQVPKLFPDSSAYFQIAKKPLSIDYFFYRKPPTVPLLYRLLGSDPDVIATFQRTLALFSGCVLVWTLAFVTSARQSRWIVAVVGAAWLLAPLRLGFSSTVLSESINDSLGSLVLAGWILLSQRGESGPNGRASARRHFAWAGFLILAAAWIFARDTNGLVTIVALAVLVAVKGWRNLQWADRTWGTLVLLVALFAMYSGQTTPPDYTPGQFSYGWEATVARGPSTQKKVFFLRVLPNQDAVDYYRAQGMPWTPELDPFVGRDVVGDDPGWLPGVFKKMIREASFAPTLSWLRRHGASTYARWILRQPVAHSDRMLDDLDRVVSVERIRVYMPKGWRRDTWRFPFGLFRRSTESALVALVLLLLSPMLLSKFRESALATIALAVVLSAVVGLAAAYYGDAIEIPRHCYPSARQAVLGLLLGWIARVDLTKGEPHPKTEAN